VIIVRLPSTIRGTLERDLTIDERVETIGALVAVLERQRPDLRPHLHDSLYNFAVNDTLILHGADAHPLRDGDIVELIPTIAGGSGIGDWRIG
jgi:molybdopterin converting factor small subunit